MRDQYLRSCDCVMIAYSITDRIGFECATTFWEQYLRVKDVFWGPAVLVGNKSDLENERKVSIQEGIDLAKKLNIPFIETR